MHEKFCENIESFANLEQTDVTESTTGLANVLNVDVRRRHCWISGLSQWRTNKWRFNSYSMKREVVQNKSMVHGVGSPKLMLELEAIDPNTECFTKVECGMIELLKCLEKFIKKKRRLESKSHIEFPFYCYIQDFHHWRYNFCFISLTRTLYSSK